MPYPTNLRGTLKKNLLTGMMLSLDSPYQILLLFLLVLCISFQTQWHVSVWLLRKISSRYLPDVKLV